MDCLLGFVFWLYFLVCFICSVERLKQRGRSCERRRLLDDKGCFIEKMMVLKIDITNFNMKRMSESN
jgi:hypothetical protein